MIDNTNKDIIFKTLYFLIVLLWNPRHFRSLEFLFSSIKIFFVFINRIIKKIILKIIRKIVVIVTFNV